MHARVAASPAITILLALLKHRRFVEAGESWWAIAHERGLDCIGQSAPALLALGTSTHQRSCAARCGRWQPAVGESRGSRWVQLLGSQGSPPVHQACFSPGLGALRWCTEATGSSLISHVLLMHTCAKVPLLPSRYIYISTLFTHTSTGSVCCQLARCRSGAGGPLRPRALCGAGPRGPTAPPGAHCARPARCWACGRYSCSQVRARVGACAARG